ncbi:MAG: thiol peroxidase, partial [Candidatus Sabulitectum sp.]|nr:thiol peroxidase [Candidatus Sabulitectum sp.]
MAIVILQGNQIETVGALPEEGMKAPGLNLTATDLSMKELKDYAGNMKVLNIFPSLDTGVCAASVRRFNKEAGGLDNTVVLCISADLPFAHSRFCEVEGL